MPDNTFEHDEESKRGGALADGGSVADASDDDGSMPDLEVSDSDSRASKLIHSSAISRARERITNFFD